MISRRRLISDSLLVFLNISLSYTLIPYLLFGGIHRFLCALAIVIINTIYTFVFFGGRFYIGHNPAIYAILYLNMANIVSSYITNTGWQAALVSTVSLLSFYILLCNIYRDYQYKGMDLSQRLFYLFRGYFWLVAVNITSCIILFIISSAGISLLTNNVSNSYDLFTSNVENLGATYYFPFHLGVVNYFPFDIRIPFFQEQGFILGFYHESHTLTFMLYPALFLLLYYYESKRYVIIMAFFFISLLAGSTTNILCILLIIIVYILYLSKSNIKKTITTIVIVLLTSYLVFNNVDSSIFDFIFLKLDSSSSGYSQNMIEYAFTPKTFWGTNCFDTSEMTSTSISDSKDVGWIKFFINLLFLCIMLINGIKLFLSNKKMGLPVLLFVAYFFFHSSKVAMSSYSLTMLPFVCFILYVINNDKEKYEYK